MAVKFNPFSGQLQIDEKGSGGGSSYIDGEVAAYGDLSLDAGVAPLNSAWLVREASGTWLLGRKPAGIYIRTATAGVSRDADYTYAGTFPDVFEDAHFAVVNSDDSTKLFMVDVGSITPGTTRTLTIPDASGTIELTSTVRQPSTVYADAVYVTGGTLSGINGIYLRAGDDNGRGFYKSTTAGYSFWWDSGNGSWILSDYAQVEEYFTSDSDVTYPWQATIGNPWTQGTDAAGTTVPTVAQATLSQVQFDAASGSVGVKSPKSGNAASSEVVLGNDTRLTNARTPTSHTHTSADINSQTASNGHVLTADGSGGAGFAALPASGVTGAAASASDVLGVSGANITGVDATADRLVFWDDSASKLTYGTPADAGAAAASHTHAASDITSGTIDTARLASGTANSGTFLRGDQTWAAAGGVTTGSVDNAILRADGTGGSTSQSSDLVIDDATTSTQANIALVNNHSETNSALVLSPKGTGAFIVGPKPDGTSTGGNARGLKAVDLSFQRAAATQVASGNYSMVLGGDRCTASGTTAIAGGERATASAAYAIALGRVSTASGNAAAVIGGQDNTASGAESIVVGGDTNTASAYVAAAFGNFGLADRSGLIAQANGRFAANGDAQWIHMVLRAKTTTNSAVELLINNGRVTNGRLTCPSGKIISGIINIHGVKSDGSASAHYVRQFQVKNVGGTSSYPYTAVTVGTDYASSTSITFNDPDTNGDALSVSVTGIASETWRWTAHVSAVETTYGT